MSSVFSKYGDRGSIARPANLLLTLSLIAGLIGIAGASMLLFAEGAAGVSQLTSTIIASTSPMQPGLVNQKLVGQWLTKDPQASDLMIFLFAADGKFFLISEQSSFDKKVVACQFQYKLNASSQPMQLDIILDGGKTIQTIFEFTPGGDLRLQMHGTQPGKPRPTALADTATELQKISDDTALPPNTELKQGCS